VRRTLDTNVDVVLLRLLDGLAGVFIRFRERVCKAKLRLAVFRMRFRVKRQGSLPKVLRFSMDIRLSVSRGVGGVSIGRAFGGA
jgi:hypothetical protein